jgi:3-oxoacyl-[acyl-carrier-protein] synthase-3
VRYDDVYVAGVASWLPPSTDIADAVAAGVCPPEVADAADVQAVAVSTGEAPPEMAARAARLAIERSRCDGERVALIAYADMYYPGHDAWLASSYIQRLAVGGHNPTISVEVRQLANGGMVALELAAGYLSGTRQHAAVVAAADRFSLPGYDRWRSLAGTPLGDGAAALVVSRDSGFARVRCVVSWSEPELEGARRGDDPFGVAPFSLGGPVDVAALHKAFIARLGEHNWHRLTENGRRSVVRHALEEAGLRLDQIDWFVLPNLGGRRLRAEYTDVLGIDLARTAWDSWGRCVGHLGAADQFAGLEHLLLSGRLRAGQHCMLLGNGGDFTWSCALLEILRRPEWAGREPVG